MLVTLGVALALTFQVGQVGPPNRHKPIVKDSVADSASFALTRGRANRHEGRRAAVTGELLATAFKDPAARTLLLAARRARLAVDSALLAYDSIEGRW